MGSTAITMSSPNEASCEFKHAQDTMTTMRPACTVATPRYEQQASPAYWHFLAKATCMYWPVQ